MSISTTNLIVNQIPKTWTLSDFRAIFEPIGEIKSCTVIKDKTSKESLGYGFIDFVREEDAQEAVNQMNNKVFEDKNLKIAFARKSSAAARKGGTRIFVSKLPPETTEDKLQELFGEFGEIIETQLPLKANGTTKGYAFITYQEEIDAKASIEALNQYSDEFFTQPISVKISVSDLSIQAEKKKAAHQVALNANTNVTPLPFATNGVSSGGSLDSQLINSSNNGNGGSKLVTDPITGQIVDISMIPPPPPKRKRTLDDCSNNGGMIDGKKAAPAEKLVLPEIPVDSDGLTLFVYNIGRDTEESQMKQVLLNQGVGPMLYLAVARDPTTSLSRNFAFIKFRNPEDAQQTIATLHRTDLFGCGPVDIKFRTFPPPNSNSSKNPSSKQTQRQQDPSKDPQKAIVVSIDD